MLQLYSKGLIKPLHSQLQGLKRAVDHLLIFLSLWLSLKVYAEPLTLEYVLLCFGGIVVFSLFAENQEIYHIWRGAPMFDEAVRVLLSWTAAVFVMTSGLYFIHPDFKFFFPVLELWLPLAPFSIILLHSMRRWLLSFLRFYGFNTRFYAILGANHLGLRLKTALNNMPWLGYRFLGFFDDRTQLNAGRVEIDDQLLAGNFQDLLALAKSGEVDYIYITLPMRAEHRINQFVQELADSTVSVHIVPDFFVFNLIQSKVSNVQGIPVVTLFDTPFNAFNAITKRIEDLFLCALILPLIALPMLMIAIAIKLTSPGPVIFKQKRYGIKGEQIEVWKFRSMTVCENGDDIKQATAKDSRVTPLGAFLRRTSLDELPQFLNVLFGDMSVVGPRPHAVAHNEFYRKQIQGYMLRHKVKPGITGQAQINGCRGETDTIDKMEARIHHDLEYIRHWSLWLDIKIVSLTILKGFTGSQVY